MVSPEREAGTVDPHAQTLPSDGERMGEVTPHDPLVGTTIGHFRIDSLLGQGGMGAVYRAWDVSLERPVALKTLLFDSPPSRARFIREARSQAQLRHPNVVPIHFVGEADGMTYLVMDLVEGESLAGLLDREKQVSEERALDIVDAVAAALEAANASALIHRDIKPSNILVEKSGRVLLADFGLAKGVRMLDVQGGDPVSDPAPGTSGAQVTHAGTIVGTPTYLAPEQASGDVVDHRADIYALGITLYELLAGQPPFTSTSRSALLEQHRAQEVFSLRMLLPEIRPAVDELVLRMLRKRPDERFATYAALRSALVAARAPLRVDAPFFPRAVAFGVDFATFGLIGLFAGALSTLLVWPVAATAMGAAEAYFGRTLGKRLMQIRAVDPHGAKLSFGRAVVRSMIKLAGPLLVVVVNDLTVVGRGQKVGGALVLIAWFASLALSLGRGHLTLHDRLTRTRVISALGPSARS